MENYSNSEELQEEAIEQLEKAQARLRKVETEADRFRGSMKRIALLPLNYTRYNIIIVSFVEQSNQTK
ncbi:hypothetical protein VNO78_37302 [Psophocarpus tetragonolobus]|uniref:Uncharacterized protein n=1 Tax=Psophocarpus tetragonolobus TaxID=3891 RepID=A0AAN9NJH1_PSOTE